MKENKKDLLIDIAQNLFYQQGIRATGIDLVLANSGVAKKTLYNHFDSKEALIIATLERRDQQFMAMMQQKVTNLTASQTATQELKPTLALFDAHYEWINSDNFHGCMFINASAEYPVAEDPIHLMCLQHKQNIVGYIETLLPTAISDKPSTALQLALLLDGAIVMAHTMNDKNSARFAKQAAMKVLGH
ncbi:TetR/AcrR family transcriptional regulator [Paraglaciecola aquimarina]|uniref:TetR/AcrR family transcriptional regulator n=1 Tax=Paraglaciecola algarum TaxID=3050085 RepID=A0ABS9D829_9ALTE|nr:TetR/AcrR family transcriptional regulator [Paraglaciecola sp. G1-23]MCF2949111.1 TetR/AcrR family transcriptional regulator [Paraglaciecola sp. G1-23]